MKKVNTIIKIQNLSFKYNRMSNILTNINLSFSKGKIYTVLGLNGSGKTTLIKLLAGINKPNSGKIFINNIDLSKIKIKERSKIFSYVPQVISIENEYTVLEYLRFSFVNKYKFYQEPSLEDDSKIRAILNEVNMSSFINTKINNLSGGQRQIIELCAAFLQDTEIIFLDEPTSALDLKNQQKVLSILKAKKDLGKTIILSTHDPNHVLFLESEVIIVENGIVNQNNVGSYKEIIKVDKLKKIYGDNIKSATKDNIVF
ncbi:ABC transporter ATP-binding protein [Mycoplasma sp. CSL10137]|uniref:ABC transporter ATP-binding protein n=1 Tax=Mycoplasma sp. CSL10137 TaxID=2813824 RepID=UPI00197BC084|nr:ABC transporter ATP-binding protein [Mycoplasma sp. CSL10137]MBN4083824.1 ABC transporter ATP-binding protein [Mycoplasma sp. CSL10137]